MQPTISVIIPTFNHGEVVGNAIQSVIRQNYHEIEIIVIDDGSTDNTKNTIATFGDSRIMYLKNQKNRGLDKTINKGIKKTKGKYICLLDADDILPPNSLRSRVSHLMKNNYDAVHTGITIALKDDHKYIAPLDTSSLKKIIQFLKKFPPNTGINNATFMYRREVFKKIGYRNETATFFPHNDFEYALRTLLYCNVGVVNSSSYEYHQQVGSHSSIHGSSANAKKKFGDLTAEYLNKFNEKLLLC